MGKGHLCRHVRKELWPQMLAGSDVGAPAHLLRGSHGLPRCWVGGCADDTASGRRAVLRIAGSVVAVPGSKQRAKQGRPGHLPFVGTCNL